MATHELLKKAKRFHINWYKIGFTVGKVLATQFIPRNKNSRETFRFPLCCNSLPHPTAKKSQVKNWICSKTKLNYKFDWSRLRICQKSSKFYFRLKHQRNLKKMIQMKRYTKFVSALIFMLCVDVWMMRRNHNFINKYSHENFPKI